MKDHDNSLADPIVIGDLHSELVYAWNVLAFHADTIRKAPQMKPAVLRFIKIVLLCTRLDCQKFHRGDENGCQGKMFHWLTWRQDATVIQLADGQEMKWKKLEFRAWYKKAHDTISSEKYHLLQMKNCLHDVQLSLLKMAGTYPQLHGAEVHRRKLLYLIRRVEMTAQHVDKPILGHARCYMNSNHDYSLWLQQQKLWSQQQDKIEQR